MTLPDAKFDPIVWRILLRYGIREDHCRVELLQGHGGFSGGSIFQVEMHTDPRRFCLREWPSSMQEESRLRWIHDILVRVESSWPKRIPAPVNTLDGRSFVRQGQVFWELAPWMPGKADYRSNPSQERFQNAVRAAATFHRLAGGAEIDDRIAPGLLDRINLARRSLDALAQLENLRFGGVKGFDFERVCREAVTAFRQHGRNLYEELNHAREWLVPVQICIRDLHHEHIFFEADEVTGIVDFGTMRVDHIGLDLARLIGSLEEDRIEAWNRGIELYQEVGRQLSTQETKLIRLYDRANVLLSGLNWIRWLFVERRNFGDLSAVERRLAEISRRLQPFLRGRR